MFPDGLTPEVAKQMQEVRVFQGTIVFGFLLLALGFFIAWMATD